MLQAGAQPLSQQLAKTAMTIWPDSFVLENDKFAKWRYDQGVILKGIEGIWYATGDASWYNYIQKSMDFYVQGDGSIKGYKKAEFNIDHINNGKLLLLLYRVTGKEKYFKAAQLLRNQLKEHPRTSEGGFWHKNIYPNQMWLDGLYMAQPFYAEYAMLFGEGTAFNDIAKQFVLMETHARDAKSGLLYHGWDESREQQWADKKTGLSPNFWGRALGWFGMAMVDALDHFPENHAGKASIIQILNRFAKAVTDVQDKNSGLWYDVPNLPNEPNNYVEASASSMLVYTLAKGVRKGYIPASYLQNAQIGYNGIIKQFIKTEGDRVNLHGTVAVSGLGGKPYRDGSFEYYMSEPVVVNDPKGVGAFIKAAVELEMVPLQSTGKGKTVVLDYFFNNERKKDHSGRNVRYHYTWEDKSNGGFSFLGNLFEQHGANLTSLETAPASANLQKANVYIIVDPDTEKETEKPNYIQPAHITVIADWVKNGGVLVLMSNDAGNAEFKNFNQLAGRFGIQFYEDNFNLVKDSQFEQGAVVIPPGHSIFKTAKKLFIKELATLDVKPPAKTILSKENKAIAAVADYGKGKVFAIGDPWLYNEYVDGRKLPADFENYKAAADLVRFVLNPSGKPLALSVNNFVSNEIIVDPSGNGGYKSIQAAINSLADVAYQTRVIQIKNGIYNEKLYIEKHNIILRGESREGVVITQAIARDEWRCGHADDWGVATVNVDGNDISLENLTVINSFGFDLTENKTIDCKSDSTGKKLLAKNGHQMALRTLNGTRLRAINCHFKSFGGDTVSPWDVETGMFYFKDCIMEGSVDLYCPRGWAWAENCHFIVRSGTAAIWHDGSKHEDSKTVLMNCSFEGFDGFNLGRFHRDAQFYIINSKFPQNMADKDIYLVPTDNIIKWGKRVYYHNSHRTGGDYLWHSNNLHTAPGSPRADDITVQWLFKNKWNPEHATKARASAVLKKLDNNSTSYGAALAKDKMPAMNPANDFTKQAIPYYKTEGPAWENDKVGFRLYLDVRNAKDIFGKTTAAPVMDTVGTYGDKYYHYFDPAWGMDILKVGTSLGAGALAIKLKAANKKDTIFRLGGKSVGETSYELVKDGPDTAIIRLHYKNWKVLNRTYNLTEEISISKGNYFYESKVTMKGLRGDEKLVTGIVNLKSNDYKVLKEDSRWILYTHDIQSENNDYLGMAVVVNAAVNPEAGETPKEGKGITATYTVSMNIKNNQPVVFRFYAAWEQTDNRFKDENYFRNMLLQDAAKWNNDKTIMAKK
jgi:unsaturated rhamnogalacturonyl hydrolase